MRSPWVIAYGASSHASSTSVTPSICLATGRTASRTDELRCMAGLAVIFGDAVGRQSAYQESHRCAGSSGPGAVMIGVRHRTIHRPAFQEADHACRGDQYRAERRDRAGRVGDRGRRCRSAGRPSLLPRRGRARSGADTDRGRGTGGGGAQRRAVPAHVVARGVRLNELVGKGFRVGEVECLGVELCEPCLHLQRRRRCAGILRPEPWRSGSRRWRSPPTEHRSTRASLPRSRPQHGT
jgi:hypothetical protein